MLGEFRVGDFTVKPRTLMISRQDTDVRVEPKMMDLLVYLAKNAGELVEKKDIISEVWAEYFVTEDVLSNTVWKLRQAFKDHPRRPQFIETIYKKGYRLVAPVRFPGSLRNVAGSQVLSVGHESEMADLQSCFQAVASGSRLLVCVSGEAGIGKTTIIQNFLHIRSGQDCFTGQGKCSENLSGSAAYLPIIEMLDDLTLSSPDSDVARQLKHIAPCWYTQVFPHSERSFPVELQTPASSVERMKRELTDFFSDLSDRHPVILFLDDIHWADTSSIDLLTYLYDHCPAKRILVLTAYRPEILLASNHPFINLSLRLKAHGVCREVPLPLLQRKDISAYVDQAFPGHRFPSSFPSFLHLRTEGNPLFMVDLLAHFHQHKLIEYDASGACWILRQFIPEFDGSIPDSIKSLIHLKIRQLDEQKQRFLCCAAIQGPEFDSAVIAQTLGAEQSQVEESLQELESIHAFVHRLASKSIRTPRAFEQYRFNHILYRDALVEALSPGRKASLSGSVARSLCEIHAGEPGIPESQIALLFEAAGDFSNAAQHFLAAIQRSFQVSAYPEALTLARRGLDVLDRIPDGPRRTSLEFPLRKGLALAVTQQTGYAHPEAKDAYIRAYEVCTRTGDSEEASRCLLSIAAYWMACANLKEAIKVCQKYRQLSASCRNDILETWCYLISSIALSHSGEFVRGLEHARKCLAIGDLQRHEAMLSFGDFDPVIIGRIQLARTLSLIGYPDQGRSNAEQAIADVRNFEHPYTSALALFMASWFFECVDDYKRSLECSEEAIQISVQYGFLMQEGWARAFSGWAIANLGRLQKGFEELERGIQTLSNIGWRLGVTELLGLKALTLSRLENSQSATVALEQAFSLMQETGETYYEAELHNIRAQLQIRNSASSNAALSETCLRESIALARKQRTKWFELRAATVLAQYYMDHGCNSDGYKVLHPVYSWFKEGFDTPNLRHASELLKRLREF